MSDLDLDAIRRADDSSACPLCRNEVDFDGEHFWREHDARELMAEVMTLRNQRRALLAEVDRLGAWSARLAEHAQAEVDRLKAVVDTMSDALHRAGIAYAHAAGQEAP